MKYIFDKKNPEDRAELRKLHQKAINTFDHNCGRKKSTFIRYRIQNHGCPKVGCRICGKTPKSKTKSKGMQKLKINMSELYDD